MSAPTAAQNRSRVEQMLFAVAFLIAACLIGVQTWRLIPSGSSSVIVAFSQHMAISDADLGIIFTALRLKPTFLSTFAWWHERWAGPFGYWRPLTSQGYWLEYRAFGSGRYDLWMIVMAVSHLCFTALLGVLTYRLTGSKWVALLTAYLFAGARAVGSFSVWSFGNIPCTTTTIYWKNEPEVWAGICALGAMLFAQSGRWAFAVLLSAMSICFKESGWLTWPLVFLVLVPDRQYRNIPLWVYGSGLAVCFALLAFRSSLSMDIYAGNHATNNVHWLSRYWGQVAGFYLTDLTSGSAPLAVFSLLIVLTMQVRAIPLAAKTALIGLALCACAYWFGLANGTDFTAGLTVFLDASIGLFRWLMDLGYVICAYCLFRHRPYRLPALILIAMILLSALPVVASVLVGNHTLYLTYGLECAVVALALVATTEAVMAWGKTRNDELHALVRPKETQT